MTRLTIRVEKDGLSAFVTIAKGPAVDRSAFDAELRSHGIVAGLDDEAYAGIAEGLMDVEYACDEVLIARGREVKSGRDGWLELMFAEGIQAGHVREDGSLDYHDRDLLKPVESGDILGHLHAPVAGVPGLKVDGKKIEPDPVRKVSIELRSGVATDVEGRIRATRGGVVLYVHEKMLDIVDHHVHKGAVDLHSGNLRMNGSLQIQGDIKHPFSVVASGNIDIRGNVDGSTVCAGGALQIKGGVRGATGAIVSAEGDITAVHAESAELNSGGHLRVQEAINCQLRAAAIQVSARLRGGQAIAENQISAKEAGAPGGVATRLSAGEPLPSPVEEVRERIHSLKAERMAERASGRTSDRGKGGKVGRVRAELDAEQVRRLAERARRREALVRTASVEIGLAHPGVSISLGAAHVLLNEATRSTRYLFDAATSAIRAEKIT
jgi:uncharacterized protein